MRYKIELYKDENYREVVELIKNNSKYSIPQPDFLKDLSIMCRDINTYKIVGFITALVPKYADTAYVSYLVTDKKIHGKGLKGNRILKLLYDALDKYLKTIGIKYYLGCIDVDNKNSKHLYERNNAENWGESILFRRTIP